MKILKKCSLLLIYMILGIMFELNAQSSELLDVKKLETYLNIIHQKKGFNGELLVAKGEKILFQETVGLASQEHSVELKKGAKYRIASISKTFTGTLTAMAQQEKQLKIEDKISNYIVGLSNKFDDVTIKQLLTHTSGLPHNEGIKDYWQIKSKISMTTEQVIEEINALDLVFKPGSDMRYSSLGYYLLATILEKVYEDDFHNILKSKILDKLQMTKTGMVNSLKIIPKMTTGYHLISDDSLVVAPYRNYSMLKGAGDIYTTSTDLLKWNNAFFTNTLIKKETENTIIDQKSTMINVSNHNYGYGWYYNDYPRNKKYHGGGTWGFSTHNTIFPDDKISIIILSNISTLPVSTIASDVEKIVFGERFQIPVIEEVINEGATSFEIYSGKFISDSNKMLLTISEIEGRLLAKLGSNPPFQIYPKGNHRFVGRKIDIEIIFEIKNNSTTSLRAERMGESFHFSKAIN